MADKRIEQDSMGPVEVPADALYGAQTQRALNNFPISAEPLPQAFIRALLQAKAAAALANRSLGLLPEPIATAIVDAVTELLADPQLMRHFPVDTYQTGSGTSTNMNANEVLATLASRLCAETVSPNDHVNFGQSSNDIIPSVVHISATKALVLRVLPALDHLQAVIRKKAAAVDGYVKTGRTHLMDAMPVRMSQPLEGWAAQIDLHRRQLTQLLPELQALAQGGTAVGTGINAHPEFAARFCAELNILTGLSFTPADNYFARIGSQDVAVMLSGQLRAVAVTLMKIANDLRWMNSGPLAGLGEIELEALQPGSSIMPGKVNPVLPEAAAMVAAQVIGLDSAITVAGQSGNFELNVMLPLIARNLLHSCDLLSNICPLLADKAIASFRVNESRLNADLARNPILVTALNPVIGYMQAAEIAKQAYAQGRPVIEVALEKTSLTREELERLLDPQRLTQGGFVAGE